MDVDTVRMWWGLGLLGIGCLLFMAEVFVPSGGIIGLAAAGSAIVGIVMLMMFDTVVGLIATALALASLPFLFAFAIKVFPRTPFGRLISLQNQQQPLTDPNGKPSESPAGNLIGAEGRAMTDLRPVGTCLIGDQRRECLATTGMIEVGSQVKVVSVDGMQIKVSRA